MPSVKQSMFYLSLPFEPRQYLTGLSRAQAVVSRPITYRQNTSSCLYPSDIFFFLLLLRLSPRPSALALGLPRSWCTSPKLRLTGRSSRLSTRDDCQTLTFHSTFLKMGVLLAPKSVWLKTYATSFLDHTLAFLELAGAIH